MTAAKQSKYAESARQFPMGVTVFKADDTRTPSRSRRQIGVYTGIFPPRRTKRLAAVWGTRWCIALARHGAGAMSPGRLAQVAWEAASIALGQSGMSPGASQAAMAGLAWEHRSASCCRSAASTNRRPTTSGSCSPPRRATTGAKRCACGTHGQAFAGAPPEFLSTHPDTARASSSCKRGCPKLSTSTATRWRAGRRVTEDQRR